MLQICRKSVCRGSVRSWHLIALCVAMLPVDSFRISVGSRMMTMAPLQVIGSSGDESFSSSSSSLAGRLQYAANDAISGIQSDVKVGVLLLNLGGPETTQDVEGFLYNLFADPDIIRLPSFLSLLQKPIAYFIAKRRAPKSTAAYQSIGGGSPIVKVPCLVLTTIYIPPPPHVFSRCFSVHQRPGQSHPERAAAEGSARRQVLLRDAVLASTHPPTHHINLSIYPVHHLMSFKTTTRTLPLPAGTGTRTRRRCWTRCSATASTPWWSSRSTPSTPSPPRAPRSSCWTRSSPTTPTPGARLATVQSYYQITRTGSIHARVYT